MNSKVKENTKSHKSNFGEGSIRHWVLRMGLPGMIMMFAFGLYTFADSILSVQLAPDAYENDQLFQGAVLIGQQYGLGAKDVVRAIMNPTSVIVNTLFAIAMGFAQGTATRQVICIGRGDIEKAKANVRTGTMYGILAAIIAMPILLLVGENWMKGQMGDFDVLSSYSFKYASIIVYAAPIIVINQIMTFLLRSEGNNKAILVGVILPIFLNLGLDWVFMGPVGMGVDGGAWATFISHSFTFIILVSFAIKDKSEYVNLKVMFGFKIEHIALVGIALVGMAPFLLNMSFTITQTLINNNAAEVAKVVYPTAPTTLNLLSAGVWPIFMLAFPALIGFVQGVMPVAAYNYGQKNFERVKETVKWTFIIALAMTLVVYVSIALIMARTLLEWLGTSEVLVDVSVTSVRISLIGLFPYTVVASAMVLFGSTDKIWRNLYVNTAFGIICYIPTIYIIKEIAINNPSFEYWYWFSWLMTASASALTAMPLMWHAFKNIKKKTKSLDEIILNIENKITTKFAKKA